VRAVLNRLQSSALVEFKHNRGAFIASPTLAESSQVFKARICIEREVALELGARIDDHKLALLEAQLEREQNAHNDGDNARAISLSGEFHLLAARLAGNEVLTRFLRELISRTSLVLTLHGHHNSAQCGIDEHRAIIDALKACDAEQAAAAMVQHLTAIADRTDISTQGPKRRGLTDILARYGGPGVNKKSQDKTTRPRG
jgi:DNA-binding GntR family transcriptional regulator